MYLHEHSPCLSETRTYRKENPGSPSSSARIIPSRSAVSLQIPRRRRRLPLWDPNLISDICKYLPCAWLNRPTPGRRRTPPSITPVSLATCHPSPPKPSAQQYLRGSERRPDSWLWRACQVSSVLLCLKCVLPLNKGCTSKAWRAFSSNSQTSLDIQNFEYLDSVWRFSL